MKSNEFALEFLGEKDHVKAEFQSVYEDGTQIVAYKIDLKNVWEWNSLSGNANIQKLTLNSESD
jgi:hypothetical protein